MLYMPISPAYALHAPVIKVPFLLANGFFTFRGFTAPEKPPLTREREKAEPAPGITLRYPKVHYVLQRLRMTSMVRHECTVSWRDPGLTMDMIRNHVP